jgi:hypothetical protein
MLAVGSKPGGPFKRVDKGTYALADATTPPPAEDAPANEPEAKPRSRKRQKETPAAGRAGLVSAPGHRGPLRGPAEPRFISGISRREGGAFYGAQQAQPVASTGKSAGRRNRGIKPNLLPWVATGCRRRQMVRRGSTVRVRQRALKYLQICIFVV